MYEDLRHRAIVNIEEKKKRKKTTQIIAVVFGSIIFFLAFISMFITDGDRVYMLIPITVLVLTYGIIHTVINGFPFLAIDDDISETDIELEIAKIYRRSRISTEEDLSDEEILELRELDEMVAVRMEEKEDYI